MSDKNNLRALLGDAARRSIKYRESLATRPVAPSEKAVGELARFIEPMPDDGMADADVLAMLDDFGSPSTVAMAGPRFFGFVIGGSMPVTIATNWLSTAWDQNVGMHSVTPAAATLEQVSLDWMIELLGLPEGSGAGFVTGATIASFTCLAAARHRVYADIGWNVEADGLIGAPPVTVVVGEEVHPTLTKSLGLLGLGRERVVRVPVDKQGRLIASALPKIEGPSIVCTQVGNVNTGAFDPVSDICDAVKPAGAWVHVDGAFGLWANVSAAHRYLVEGVEKADSWGTDAHKWLNVPYDCGLAFVRNPSDLHAAMAIRADYLMTDSAFRNPSDFTPELSRRARGIDVWAGLRSLGRRGLEDLVDRCCKHAKRFADGLSAAGFAVLNDVELNQVLVSFGDSDTTHKIIEEIRNEGTCWCSSTIWQEKTAMRISVCNWSTADSDVEASLDAMIKTARQFQ